MTSQQHWFPLLSFFLLLYDSLPHWNSLLGELQSFSDLLKMYLQMEWRTDKLGGLDSTSSSKLSSCRFFFFQTLHFESSCFSIWRIHLAPRTMRELGVRRCLCSRVALYVSGTERCSNRCSGVRVPVLALSLYPVHPSVAIGNSDSRRWISGMYLKHVVHASALLVFFFFNWIVADLQCCVNFCCTAKWFRYTYVYFFFFLAMPCGM